MSNWGDPSHSECCCSLTPPALSLSGLVDKYRCPLTIRDQHLAGLPSHTPTAPAVRVCVSVCVYASALSCSPAEVQLCLNATNECQSVHVVPVSHTAGLRYCVGTVSSMGVMIAMSCFCNPHTETNRGFPGPHPLRHICQPISLSVSMSVFIHILSASRCNSLHSLSARLRSPVRYQLSASLQLRAWHVVLALSCVRHPEIN